MKTTPNCKINLGLHIVRRRADGYHDLESLFLPVPLCDELTMQPADRFSFKQEGIPIGGDPETNLVVRAYRLMEQQAPRGVRPMEIRLRKNIPFGAGLGGGSSDAAFAITMLNELWQLHLDTDRLCMLAARLGADCPFFVLNKAAYVTGIGDQLEPLDGDPLGGFRLMLFKPEVAVSTAEAYRDIVPRERRPHTVADADLRRLVRQPVSRWRDTIVNDFEATVFAAHPELGALKQQLYDIGAIYVSMSGSGSALFALFDKGSAPTPLPPKLKNIQILDKELQLKETAPTITSR